MQCPFLTKSGRGFYCEVLECVYGGRQQIFSTSLCEGSWESLCPYFHDAVDGAGDPPQENATVQDSILRLGHVGHVNRLGGHRTIVQDLL